MKRELLFPFFLLAAYWWETREAKPCDKTSVFCFISSRNLDIPYTRICLYQWKLTNCRGRAKLSCHDSSWLRHGMKLLSWKTLSCIFRHIFQHMCGFTTRVFLKSDCALNQCTLTNPYHRGKTCPQPKCSSSLVATPRCRGEKQNKKKTAKF